MNRTLAVASSGVEREIRHRSNDARQAVDGLLHTAVLSAQQLDHTLALNAIASWQRTERVWRVAATGSCRAGSNVQQSCMLQAPAVKRRQVMPESHGSRAGLAFLKSLVSS